MIEANTKKTHRENESHEDNSKDLQPAQNNYLFSTICYIAVVYIEHYKAKLRPKNMRCLSWPLWKVQSHFLLQYLGLLQGML